MPFKASEGTFLPVVDYKFFEIFFFVFDMDAEAQ